MRVLIVEDDFIGSRLMKKFLEAECFCHLAFDGREAIEAFEAALKEEKPYDLLFLDIMMPEVNGIDVLKTVRRMEEERGIGPDKGVKVIMTTAMNDADVIMESFNARCDGYIVKPVRREKTLRRDREPGVSPPDQPIILTGAAWRPPLFSGTPARHFILDRRASRR